MLRPIEPADVPAVHALLTDPTVARHIGTTPYDPPAVTAALLASGWSVPATAHRVGAFGAGRLLGLVDLIPQVHPRARHVGRVRLVGRERAANGELLSALRDEAFGWFGLSRLETEVHPLDPALEDLEAAGFEREYRKRAHRHTPSGDADSIGLALLRPGLDRGRPAHPRPAWPERSDLPGDLQIRPATPEDAVGFGANLRQPEVRWGTLQVASSPSEIWRARLQRTERAKGVTFVADVGGRIAGTASLHPEAFPSAHSAMVGMSVAAEFQGRRVGRALLEQLIEAGSWFGYRRIGLEVYPDNTRAHALYEGCGFVDEGLRVAAAWRDGELVDSLVMGRLS